MRKRLVIFFVLFTMSLLFPNYVHASTYLGNKVCDIYPDNEYQEICVSKEELNNGVIIINVPEEGYYNFGIIAEEYNTIGTCSVFDQHGYYSDKMRGYIGGEQKEYLKKFVWLEKGWYGLNVSLINEKSPVEFQILFQQSKDIDHFEISADIKSEYRLGYRFFPNINVIAYYTDGDSDYVCNDLYKQFKYCISDNLCGDNSEKHELSYDECIFENSGTGQLTVIFNDTICPIKVNGINCEYIPVIVKSMDDISEGYINMESETDIEVRSYYTIDIPEDGKYYFYTDSIKGADYFIFFKNEKNEEKECLSGWDRVTSNDLSKKAEAFFSKGRYYLYFTNTEAAYTIRKHMRLFVTNNAEYQPKHTDHSIQVVNGKQPICINGGLTDGEICSICGTVIKAQNKILPLGHNWDEGIVIKQPTETTFGVRSYTCLRCGHTKTESIDRIPQNLVSKIVIEGISKEIACGKNIQLNLNIVPENATMSKVKWSSSNTKIATVDSKGLVSIKKKAGGRTVKIIAEAMDGSGKKAVYSIRSMKGVVKKIAITGKTTVKPGKTLSLKAKVTASKGANKKVKWISSNKKYATVNASGKVKAAKNVNGKTVKITAMATDGSGKKKTIKIKIK